MVWWTCWRRGGRCWRRGGRCWWRGGVIGGVADNVGGVVDIVGGVATLFALWRGGETVAQTEMVAAKRWAMMEGLNDRTI